MLKKDRNMKDRILELDIYKGIAILLVVLGHLEIPDMLCRFIFMFHIPAFFFIAGVTYRYNAKNTFWQECKKNAYRLLIPYLIFSIIVDITILSSQFFTGTDIDWNYRFSFKSVMINVIDTLIGGGLKGVTMTHGVTWFLYAMFVTRMLLFILNKLKLNNLQVGGGDFASVYYVC